MESEDFGDDAEDENLRPSQIRNQQLISRSLLSRRYSASLRFVHN